jgi:hypothetical protein
MKTKLQKVAGGFAIAIGLGGCGSGAPPASMSDPAQVDASIQQSFDRLQALQIFAAESLVLNLPAEATACYNLPCPNSPWWQPYRDERARQAPRLATLAQAAEQANANAALQPVDMSQADAALQAITDLQVVVVGGLIQAQPQNNPLCYNLPCASDVQAAQQENQLRVAKTFATAELATKSGL